MLKYYTSDGNYGVDERGNVVTMEDFEYNESEVIRIEDFLDDLIKTIKEM